MVFLISVCIRNRYFFNKLVLVSNFRQGLMFLHFSQFSTFELFESLRKNLVFVTLYAGIMHRYAILVTSVI